MKTRLRFLSILLLFSISYTLYGSYLKDFPVSVTQPDGTVLNILATGTEAHNWYHDADNYTIIKDPTTGYYVFAVNSAEGDVVPSQHIVGKISPAAVGLTPGINLSESLLTQKIEAFKKSRIIPTDKQSKTVGPQEISKFGGNMNELVIFIRFSNQGAFTRPMSYFHDNFNNVNATSVRGFFREASGNQIDIITYFAPSQPGASVVTYNHFRPRTYYQKSTPDGYENSAPNSTEREHQLLVDAVNAVKSQVPTNINLDANNDGNIDNVVFIIQGNTDAWGDLLWPHRWSLFSKNVSINGKRVYDYNLTFENGSGAGVLSHELFHTFGAPDLYRYSNNNITPSGPWDLMSGGTWETPVHMNVYYKQKHGGWITTIPTITAPGTYTLDPVSRNPFSAYKIPIPNSTRGEFLLLEYRKKEGRYESILPSEGLVIFRVTPNLNGNGNGPDDEIYVYRPGGAKNVNGNLNQATFSQNANRTRFDDFSNPHCFMTNEQLGGFAANLGITNVSVIGDKISFNFKGGVTPPPVCTLTGTKISGTSIGTEGSWSNLGDTRDKAYDGNINTFFDSPGTLGWTGLNTGKQFQVTGIRYHARANFTARMIGGKFQGSNSADFSTGVVDLHTVTVDPGFKWTCVNITNTGNYRYLRYISTDGSHGNVAEVEFYGKEFIVNPPNQLPVVNITGPANGATFIAPANITITANASDPDGSISKVEFFHGSTLIGTDASAPYSIVFSNVAAGSYSLTAKAFDNVNATKTSSAIMVTVNPPVVSTEGINGPNCVNANTNNTYTFGAAGIPVTNANWWCNCDATFTAGSDPKITSVRFGSGNPSTVTLICGVNMSVAPWYKQYTKTIQLGACPASSPEMAPPVTIITPNPSENESVVTTQAEEIILEMMVYDAMGKLMMTEKNINKTEVMLGKDLPVGLYTVVTYTSSGIARKQFIKH